MFDWSAVKKFFPLYLFSLSKMDEQDFADVSPEPFSVKVVCTYCQVYYPSMKKCARCNCSYYCSVECQKKDWSRHKSQCYPAETDASLRCKELKEILKNAHENKILNQLREMYLERNCVYVELMIVPIEHKQYRYLCEVFFVKDDREQNNSLEHGSTYWLTAYLDAPKDRQKNGYKGASISLITKTGEEKKCNNVEIEESVMVFLLSEKGEKWFGVSTDKHKQIERTPIQEK